MSEPTDFPPIMTARLLLRPHRLEDAAALSALSDGPDVVRHLSRVPYPNPPEQVRAYIQGALERLSAGTEAPLTVTLAETGNVIGSFSIRMNGLRREAEVGYWLGKAYWGQGLASEAVRAAVDYALGPLGCRRVWATVSVDNPASRRVLAKAGLTGDERRWIKTPAREADEAEVYLVEHLAPRAPLLVAAVALDLQSLALLVVVAPVILLFFVIYGLFSTWVYRRTGNPLIAGVASGIAVAWAVGVTLPLLTG